MNWQSSYLLLLVRLLLVGLIALMVFGLFERWPNKLPACPWYHRKARMGGFGVIAGLSLLFAAWARTRPRRST